MHRVIGAAIIIFATSYYGFYTSIRLNRKIKCMDDLCTSLQMLNSYIVYSRLTVGEAFNKLSCISSNKNVSDLYNRIHIKLNKSDMDNEKLFDEIWKCEVDLLADNLELGQVYKELLYELGTFTAYMDPDMQSKHILGVKKKIETENETLKREQLPKNKIYRTAGMTVGLIIVIALL